MPFSGSHEGGRVTTTGEGEPVRVGQAKGRPMLSWVGKRPLREVRSFPAQLVSRFAPEAPADAVSDAVDWSEWPARFDRGGLLFHGDNKEVLAHLLANGFRKVDLIYIDPPFDSGAERVEARATPPGPRHGPRRDGRDTRMALLRRDPPIRRRSAIGGP